MANLLTLIYIALGLYGSIALNGHFFKGPICTIDVKQLVQNVVIIHMLFFKL